MVKCHHKSSGFLIEMHDGHDQPGAEGDCKSLEAINIQRIFLSDDSEKIVFRNRNFRLMRRVIYNKERKRHIEDKIIPSDRQAGIKGHTFCEKQQNGDNG